MLNSRILNTLIESQQAIALAQQLDGRLFMFESATVTSNLDPLNKRRIKVALEHKAHIETDWLQRLDLIPGIDPPVPPIGTSVAIGFFKGDPHDGFYLGSLSDLSNPPDDAQTNPLIDHTYQIPGDHKQTIAGNSEESVKGTKDDRTEKNLTVECGATITIKNDAGASITLQQDGSIVILDAYGRKLVWGAAGGTQYLLDFAGTALNIINASGLSINGSQVATTGAIDSRGDTIVNRGW